MKWGNQQQQAIAAVKKWLKEKGRNKLFRLFGYAGTGKTTLAKHVAGNVKGTVLYACFTGKAALVLQKKGCHGARTIHSLIYKAVQNPATGNFEFILNPDSELAYAKLLIIDEVSMVNEELARDLLSFGVPILVLGDPEQLPPVKGEGYFINAQPDFMLTEVHRQAEDNPIIRMSMDVREGRGLRPGSYGDSLVISRVEISRDRLRDMVLASDQLLCGKNDTRRSFNARVRELKGLVGADSDWHPAAGDRLICLRNNKERGLLNGSMWTANKVACINGKVFDIEAASLDTPNMPPIDIAVPREFFCGAEASMDWRIKRQFDEFTFGEAITVHKSQGSQWDDVILFDESQVFRQDARKHLYTGITRAAERITVVL